MLTDIDVRKLPSFNWGLDQGREEGLSQGREEGLNQGLSQGREEGRDAEREAIAIKLLAVMSDRNISEFTNLSIERVQALRALADQ